MRRKDREITDRAEIEAILNEATVCRIGLADGGEPYIVPLSFGYDDGAIYIHSAPEGRKIGMLAKNPRCCIEVDICDRVIRGDKPCSWGMQYRSVIGYGRAAILTAPEEKSKGSTASCAITGARHIDFSEKDLDEVTVIRIPLELVTG